MKAARRCYGAFRYTWDGPSAPCGREKGHGGDHGPSERPAPAVAHSQTSIEAAVRMAGATGHLRGIVYQAIRAGGGLTDEEGIAETGIPASTYRPRRVELVEGGLVRDSGLTRDTKSGRKAAIWIATESGGAIPEVVSAPDSGSGRRDN